MIRFPDYFQIVIVIITIRAFVIRDCRAICVLNSSVRIVHYRSRGIFNSSAPCEFHISVIDEQIGCCIRGRADNVSVFQNNAGLFVCAVGRGRADSESRYYNVRSVIRDIKLVHGIFGDYYFRSSASIRRIRTRRKKIRPVLVYRPVFAVSVEP